MSLVLPWWTAWLIASVLGRHGLRTLLAGGSPDTYLGVAWGWPRCSPGSSYADSAGAPSCTTPVCD